MAESVETTDERHLSVLQNAVTCYLSTLAAVADCMGESCPEVGGPYRSRMNRLCSRLAFDTSAEAITESQAIVEKQLQEYAQRTAFYIASHGVELQKAVDGLETIVKSLAQRQDFYGARLRQFASQLETTALPSDPADLANIASLQAAGLLNCVESMANDTQSLLLRMRNELTAVAQRMRDAEVTDRLTGLMNRREMERQIEQRKKEGIDPVILVFELSGEMRDEVAQQVAARLTSQFRHQDLICRWDEYEFLVLFQGAREIAQSRAEQIVPWIAGKYPLDDGGIADIRVDAGLVAPQFLAIG